MWSCINGSRSDYIVNLCRTLRFDLICIWPGVKITSYWHQLSMYEYSVSLLHMLHVKKRKKKSCISFLPLEPRKGAVVVVGRGLKNSCITLIRYGKWLSNFGPLAPIPHFLITFKNLKHLMRFDLATSCSISEMANHSPMHSGCGVAQMPH